MEHVLNRINKDTLRSKAGQIEAYVNDVVIITKNTKNIKFRHSDKIKEKKRTNKVCKTTKR